MPIDIVLDTDPGIDDLFAILMAAASPLIHLKALTATCGNVGIHHTTRNCLRILTLAGRADIPVYQGAERPLSGALRDASDVHGEDGLHGAELPEPDALQQAESAVDFLLRAFRPAQSNYPTLVCIGPMTNVGLALRQDPSVAVRIPRIVAMGGAFNTAGNTVPAAEFNMHCDPLAAQTALESGVPVTLIPLDTTQQTLVTPEWLDQVRALPRIGSVLSATVERYAGSGALHDPNTIAFLEEPGLYQTRRGTIHAGPEGETTLAESEDGPHQVAFSADADRFFMLLLERLITTAAAF